MSKETLLDFLVLLFFVWMERMPKLNVLLCTGFDEVFSVYFYDNRMAIF